MFFNKGNNQAPQGELQNANLTPDNLEAIDDLIAQNLNKFFKKNKKLFSDEEEDCYVLPSDIKSIIEEFSELERMIKACETEATESYINLLSDVVESTIHTRIKELSRQRMTEKVKERASAEAKDYYQTPRYYRSWRNFFRLTPNRAMQLINEQEELFAATVHLQQQINNDNLRRSLEHAQELYNNGLTEEDEDVETLPGRKARTAKPDEEDNEEQGGQALKKIN